MKETLAFLNALQQNNNREWFEMHKPTYKALNEQFNHFITQLLNGIASFDKRLKNVTAKECMFRIYRDIRFSHNKLPYKSHFAAYMCPGGKKSGYAGYYFHIEAEHEDYIGDNILAAGCYCPEPAALKSIREDIEFNGTAYRQALRTASSFTIEGNSTLSKVPSGFNKESEFADLLKLKDFSLMRKIPDKELFAHSDQLLEFTLENFKKAKQFNDLLNRAIDFITQK
ncbi:MAG: DUF2461 domain-containing protein [Bacteroidales bacterium]|jgi:uncharacterized protein (TIGR02453 family)|nr:DUF2461 domain-containing protein [Bacteroidales bacterium]